MGIRNTILVLGLVTVTGLLSAESVTLVDELIASSPAVTSIRLKAETVTRSLNPGEEKKVSRDNWEYTFKEPGLFRIDSVEDGLERRLYCDGSFVWEYVPSHKAVLETSIGHLSGATKQRKIAQAMERVELPFLLWKEALKQTRKIRVERDSGGIVVLTGMMTYNNKKTKISFWVDKNTRDCSRIELVQEDETILTLRMSGYEEQNGFRLPVDLQYTIRFEKNHVMVSAKLKEWEVNRPYQDGQFSFGDVPNGVQVLKQKAGRG
jgi:outer membrane lipoprotein-sorting protein